MKAKENININEAATKLIEKVIENESKLAPPRKLYDLLRGIIIRLIANDLWRSLETEFISLKESMLMLSISERKKKKKLTLDVDAIEKMKNSSLAPPSDQL